jgi:hypothetical protein
MCHPGFVRSSSAVPAGSAVRSWLSTSLALGPANKASSSAVGVSSTSRATACKAERLAGNLGGQQIDTGGTGGITRGAVVGDARLLLFGWPAHCAAHRHC